MTSTMVTTGTIGQPARLSIDRFGTISGVGAPLGWYVAAEDRWHDPRTDSGVRQIRMSGTPVTETRVRVPGGDVVQRVYTVADAGGITIVEIANESTLAVAVAFDRGDLMTERPIPATPIEGIDLPAGSFVLPIGHASTVRVGLSHRHPMPGALPTVPACADVVNGWRATVERAGRLELPSSQLVEALVAARCDVALGLVPSSDEPAQWLVFLDQRHRMGLLERADLAGRVLDVANAVAKVGPVDGWFADAALAAAERLLLAADERRAVNDVGRIIAGRVVTVLPTVDRDEEQGLRRLAHVERLLVRGAELLPVGVPAAWVGQSFACHGLPSVVGSTVSYAIRWHGDRPAILWQQTGSPVALTAPTADPMWVSADASGEALWRPVER